MRRQRWRQQLRRSHTRVSARFRFRRFRLLLLPGRRIPPPCRWSGCPWWRCRSRRRRRRSPLPPPRRRRFRPPWRFPWRRPAGGTVPPLLPPLLPPRPRPSPPVPAPVPARAQLPRPAQGGWPRSWRRWRARGRLPRESPAGEEEEEAKSGAASSGAAPPDLAPDLAAPCFHAPKSPPASALSLSPLPEIPQPTLFFLARPSPRPPGPSGQ